MCKARGMRIGILGRHRSGRQRARRAPGERRATTSSSVRGRSTGRWRARDELVEQWPELAERARLRRQRRRRRLRHRRHRHAVGLGAPRSRRSTQRYLARQDRRQHGERAGAGRQGVPAAGAARGSVAAHVQAAVPQCRVVAAFHHLPATELGQIGEPIDSDVLICGDDPAAVTDDQRDRRRDPGLSAARRRRAVERHGDRGVHRRAAAAERALQDPGRAEAHGNQRRPARVEGLSYGATDAALRHRPARDRAVRADEQVLMYTCGITPYDATHLGHAATFIAYDMLQRHLIDKGHTVQVRPQRHRRRRPAVRQGSRARACTTSTSRPARKPASSATWWRSTRCRSRRRPARRRRSPTSAASSAWCSTVGSPTRPAARCTSTCRSSSRSAR